MSKELEAKFKPLVFGQTIFTRGERAKECAEIAIEYAKQEAIGFHKFIKSQSFHYDYRGETFSRTSENELYTHEQLYTIYQQQNQKQ